MGLKNFEFPTYYERWIAKQKDHIIISSEKLKCANKLEWQKVKTGKILQIDNQNLKIKEYSL